MYHKISLLDSIYTMRLSTALQFIDVHCHLTAPAFAQDIATVISSMRSTGIKHVIVNGLNPNDNDNVFQLCDRFNTPAEQRLLLPAAGIYPLDACSSILRTFDPALIPKLNIDVLGEPFDVDAEILRIDTWARDKRIVAVGECGLDRHYTDHPLAMTEQERVLRALMQVAKRNDLPIILHTRKAEERVFEMLLEG